MEIGYAQTGSPRPLRNAAPATQAPEQVRLSQGILYGDGAFISLEDVALFDGERTVHFKDGSERELPEALAVSLRAYFAFVLSLRNANDRKEDTP